MVYTGFHNGQASYLNTKVLNCRDLWSTQDFTMAKLVILTRRYLIVIAEPGDIQTTANLSYNQKC